MQRFKDCKIWPGGALRVALGGDGHTPQPGHPAGGSRRNFGTKRIDEIVLGRGQLGRLNLSTATETLLRERGIPYHLEKTHKAVQLFNELAAQGKRVGGLFHSTC